MKIKSFLKTSTLDYPKTVASTVFTGGCNFKCPFCHNGDLVLEYNDMPDYSEEDVFNHLIKRKGLIDGLCITGGEPTLQKDLIPFIKKVNSLGIKIKLDTNGYKPDVLKNILDLNLLDYVAMDIKNSPKKYAITTGIPCIDLNKINESIKLIKNSGINYEFRTTVIKEFHEEKDILEIVEWLKGAKKYCLQQFMPSDKQIKTNLHSHDKETLIKWSNKIKPLFNQFEIRGI